MSRSRVPTSTIIQTVLGCILAVLNAILIALGPFTWAWIGLVCGVLLAVGGFHDLSKRRNLSPVDMTFEPISSPPKDTTKGRRLVLALVAICGLVAVGGAAGLAMNSVGDSAVLWGFGLLGLAVAVAAIVRALKHQKDYVSDLKLHTEAVATARTAANLEGGQRSP